MGFSRQESWSGLPCPPPGDLPDPGTEPPSLTSLAFAGRFSTNSATWDVHYPSGRTTGESWTCEEQQHRSPLARWDQRPTQGQRQGRGRGRGGRKRNAQTDLDKWNYSDSCCWEPGGGRASRAPAFPPWQQQHGRHGHVARLCRRPWATCSRCQSQEHGKRAASRPGSPTDPSWKN